MPETTSKAAEPVEIKKYANRRLYNTGTSAYVTLEDLAAMVKNGEDFVVYDAKTGEDITRSVLAQIIFEQENKEGQNLLPIAFLRQLIRFYGDSMQMLVPRYLEASIDSFTREQEKFRQQMAQAFGVGAFASLDEQVRRNMEMFERDIRHVHAVRAAAKARAAPPRRNRKNRLPSAGRNRRSQAAARRDEDKGRPADREGQGRQSPPSVMLREGGASSNLRIRDFCAVYSEIAASATGSSASRMMTGRIAACASLDPRPLGRGEPDQRSLQDNRSPIACSVRAASPFCTHSATVDNLSRLARSMSVCTKARSSSERDDVRHEGAVDLDDVDAELAQIAERGVAGAEIVDGDAAAEDL